MSGPITVTLSYQVRRGRAGQFSMSATALLGMAARQPGYLGAGILGTVSTGRDWQIFYRFDGESSLAEWEQSNSYARWIDYVEKFASRADARRTVGDEMWPVDSGQVRHQQRGAAPAGRARSRREAAAPEDVPVDATQVMDAARLRQAAQQRSGQHARPQEAAHSEAAPVDATQVMDGARLRQAAQQRSGRYERPRVERPQRASAEWEPDQWDEEFRELVARESGWGPAPSPHAPVPHSQPIARSEVARWEAAQREAAQREAAQREAAQREAAEREAARREAAQWEAAQWEAAQREMAQREAVERELAQREMAQREAAQREAALLEAAQRAVGNREPVHQAEPQRQQPDQRQAGRREPVDREPSRRWWGRRQQPDQPEPDREQAARGEQRQRQASPERTRGSEQPSSDPTLSPAEQRELFGDLEIPRPDGDPLAMARSRRER
ncbi:hypothetical protein ACFFS4_04090 [Kutzneria kofuensis]|uniref:ABM domain-containing protein n=1 Tax=Kutzneria kofuensis TaxID=103725 RepID=A0A7W9NMI5_9PSEU|nr:hypothetical protein [Kutzneria kofuensis]MBB5897879.1 hypothetical protein [Kutzneria kofuensis]